MYLCEKECSFSEADGGAKVQMYHGHDGLRIGRFGWCNVCMCRRRSQ